MSDVIVIAEAGVNHNGDLQMAHRLIDVAADAGADYVKFQTFRADQVVTQDAAKALYQTKRTGDAESQLDMLRRLELTHCDHMELIEHCQSAGIKFFSTAFDDDSLAMLSTMDLDLIKIPSGEITNLPYLRRIGRLQRPVILSTGMSTLGEIEAAIAVLERAGSVREHVTVLHCNTQYPTPMQDVNLRAMLTIRDALKVQVGYSDHTLGIEIPIAAVALGARVIEKHFTIDRTLPGPDHAASLEPAELKSMLSAVRNVQQAMGDGIKRPSPSESPNVSVARRSIVAATAIRRGDRFTEANLAAKRPGTGLSPMRWDEVLGRQSPRAFAPDEAIEL